MKISEIHDSIFEEIESEFNDWEKIPTLEEE